MLRAGIRAVCAQRLRHERGRDAHTLIDQLRTSEIAVATAATANRATLRSPRRVLHARPRAAPQVLELLLARRGPQPGNRRGRDARAHRRARRTCRRPGHPRSPGCGWGSLSLWAAARYPTSRIVAVSNSRTQRAFIEARARERGLANLTVHKPPTSGYRLELAAARFDRVVSVEMFEHTRNYAQLLRRIPRLAAPGRRAVRARVRASPVYAYPFEDAGATDWMAREFFTGGLMPSAGLFRHFSGRPRAHARMAARRHALRPHRRGLVRQPDGVTAPRSRCYRSPAIPALARVLPRVRGSCLATRARRTPKWLVAHYRFTPRYRDAGM